MSIGAPTKRHALSYSFFISHLLSSNPLTSYFWCELSNTLRWGLVHSQVSQFNTRAHLRTLGKLLYTCIVT